MAVSGFSEASIRPAFTVTMQLVEKASELWGIPAWRLLRRERTRKIAYPRFAVVWALREVGITYWAIAKHLHFKDHSSVMYARRQAELMRDSDPQFRHYSDILAMLARYLRRQQVMPKAAA